jgi:hypothetical protein
MMLFGKILATFEETKGRGPSWTTAPRSHGLVEHSRLRTAPAKLRSQVLVTTLQEVDLEHLCLADIWREGRNM